MILCVCTHKTGSSCVFLMLCVDVFPLVISAFLLTKSLVFFNVRVRIQSGWKDGGLWSTIRTLSPVGLVDCPHSGDVMYIKVLEQLLEPFNPLNKRVR